MAIRVVKYSRTHRPNESGKQTTPTKRIASKRTKNAKTKRVATRIK